MDLIYWSVGSSSRKGGVRLKGVNGVFVSLASYEHYFIGVDKNVEQHPSNNISIYSPGKCVYMSFLCLAEYLISELLSSQHQRQISGFLSPKWIYYYLDVTPDFHVL